jgi:hypothetical protein
MPRWSLKRPECLELGDALHRLVSITALARQYEVSFATARKWIRSCGLETILNSERRKTLLRTMIEEAPKIAKRRGIRRQLEVNLRDHGDRKLLARAIVDEFSFGYRYKKMGARNGIPLL